MNNDQITIDVKAEGIEEVTEELQSLSDAVGAFPANVMIRNCKNCTFNIYPGQTMIMDADLDKEDQEQTMALKFLELLVLMCAIVFAYGMGAGLAMMILLWIIDKFNKK